MKPDSADRAMAAGGGRGVSVGAKAEVRRDAGRGTRSESGAGGQPSQRPTLGLLYFAYFAAVIIPQTLGFADKGSVLDTLWKFVVIAVFLYVAFRLHPRMPLSGAMLMTLYGASQLLVLYVVPPGISESVIVTNALTVIAMAYACLYVPWSVKGMGTKDVVFFMKSYVAFMVVACVYNLAANWSLILRVGSLSTAYSVDIASFFDNKNTFGMFLYLAVAATVFLLKVDRRAVYKWVFAFFMLSLVLTFSRTALGAAGIFLVIELLARPKRRFQNAAILGGLSAFASAAIGLSDGLKDFVVRLVIRDDSAVLARGDVWQVGFSLLQGGRLFFGYGEGASMQLLATSAISQYTHNALLTLLLDGGLIKVGLWLLVATFVLRRLRGVHAHSPSVYSWFLAINVSGLAYSMFESVTWFDASAVSFIYTVLSLSTLLLYENRTQSEGTDATAAE